MINAGMNFTEGQNGGIRSRTWGGNETGQSLNMQHVMGRVGNDIASAVFAYYYENNAIAYVTSLNGQNIGNINTNFLTSTARSRYYNEFLPAFMNYYGSMRSFLDASAGFQVSSPHGWIDGKGEIKYTNYENDAHFGTDLANGRSGDPIYMGISGIVKHTGFDDPSEHRNGNWMIAEYGYMFEGLFIGSGIYGEYMHMENYPDFRNNSFLTSNQIIGTVGHTGRSVGNTPKSEGNHLHYTIYTLENYAFSQTTLQMLLNNNISKTVLSKKANTYTGTYNGRAARKITYDIENFLRGL
jgi:murein DD-endopeptidase MepM/ murein hydrolase activator NlpD